MMDKAEALQIGRAYWTDTLGLRAPSQAGTAERGSGSWWVLSFADPDDPMPNPGAAPFVIVHDDGRAEAWPTPDFPPNRGH